MLTVRHFDTTHTPTMGPSATCSQNPSSSRRPSHFRDLFFFPSDRFSPPPPTHVLPSAVLATKRPDGLTDKESTNGGESEIPSEGGGAAGRDL